MYPLVENRLHSCPNAVFDVRWHFLPTEKSYGFKDLQILLFRGMYLSVEKQSRNMHIPLGMYPLVEKQSRNRHIPLGMYPLVENRLHSCPNAVFDVRLHFLPTEKSYGFQNGLLRKLAMTATPRPLRVHPFVSKGN